MPNKTTLCTAGALLCVGALAWCAIKNRDVTGGVYAVGAALALVPAAHVMGKCCDAVECQMSTINELSN